MFLRKSITQKEMSTLFWNLSNMCPLFNSTNIYYVPMLCWRTKDNWYSSSPQRATGILCGKRLNMKLSFSHEVIYEVMYYLCLARAALSRYLPSLFNSCPITWTTSQFFCCISYRFLGFPDACLPISATTLVRSPIAIEVRHCSPVRGKHCRSPGISIRWDLGSTLVNLAVERRDFDKVILHTTCVLESLTVSASTNQWTFSVQGGVESDPQ